MDYRIFITAIAMLCAVGTSANAADIDLKTLKCSDVNALGGDAKSSVIVWSAFTKGEVSARPKATAVNVEDLNAEADNVIAVCQMRPNRRFVDAFRVVDRQLSDLKKKSF